MTQPNPNFYVRAIDAAAAFVDTDRNSLLARDRRPHMVHARWAVMVVLRERRYSLPRIAKRLKLKCHSTVMHGIEQAPYLARRDASFAAMLDVVRAA